MISRAARLGRHVVALVWVVLPSWVLATRFDTVRTGHPLYPVLLVATLLVGVALLVRALRPRGPAAGRAGRAGRGLRVTSAVGLVLATVIVPGALAWLRPHAASPHAVAAMNGTGAVAITQDATTITLLPLARHADVGLVFQPGARVDPRAYVPLLTEIAEAGHRVVIVKQPLGLGLTALDAPAEVMDAAPEGHRWAVGGHSLGGVAASRTAAGADPRVAGLLLLASYPDGATTVHDLPVLSLYGTNDALTTPVDVAASRARLPDDALVVAVDGGIHAYFGDYGQQSGDGTPTVTREAAQRQIVDATRAFLSRPDER